MHSPMTAEEEAARARFAFGKNWQKFLNDIDGDRIARAEASLKDMLGCDTLENKSFLDIGNGSGLFSLAARNLGARVTSFDYDPNSVACARELRRRYHPDDPAWQISQGSALDTEFVEGLGTFDIVYSWGVLHHTGAMWQAIDTARKACKPGGQFFIAIYNDQGGKSRLWHFIKRVFNKLSPALRPAYTLAVMAPLEVKWFALALLSGKPGTYIRSWTDYSANSTRGMSRWRDMVDWVGGLPFEVATPEEIFDFCSARGFELQRLKTCGGGYGCNEFVFALNPVRPE